MPHPCPATTDEPDCLGPYRVEFEVSLPDGYTDVWVDPPGGGLPGAQVTELHVALAAALDATPSSTTVDVVAPGPQGQPVGRTVTVDVGMAMLFRGPADPAIDPDPEADQASQVWTAVVWISAPNPISSEAADAAYVAGQWAKQVTAVTTGSDVDAEVAWNGVWIGFGNDFQLLDPAYPESAGRMVEVTPAT